MLQSRSLLCVYPSVSLWVSFSQCDARTVGGSGVHVQASYLNGRRGCENKLQQQSPLRLWYVLLSREESCQAFPGLPPGLACVLFPGAVDVELHVQGILQHCGCSRDSPPPSAALCADSAERHQQCEILGCCHSLCAPSLAGQRKKLGSAHAQLTLMTIKESLSYTWLISQQRVAQHIPARARSTQLAASAKASRAPRLPTLAAVRHSFAFSKACKAAKSLRQMTSSVAHSTSTVLRSTLATARMEEAHQHGRGCCRMHSLLKMITDSKAMRKDALA